MSVLENIKAKFKEFGPTTWSIGNKATIYLVMLFISLFGIYQFVTLPIWAACYCVWVDPGG